VSTLVITEKRRQAARLNGAKSRGPVTPQGKALSSRNAIRHGLLANAIVLSNEDAPLFKELFHMLVARFGAIDDVELSLVEDLAASCWRARRACAIEKSILDAGIAARPHLSPIEQTTFAFCDQANKDELALLQRYEARFQNLFHRTVRAIAFLRKLTTQNLVLPNEPSK
jgi:hypothetical protein